MSNPSNVELQIILDNLIRMMPLQLQIQEQVSKMYRIRMDSLIEEGFTREEALDIIKARGLE